MSYVKTEWTNGSTRLNATNMNHIEGGIFDNDTAIGDINELETTATDLVNAINEVNNKTNTFSTNEIKTNEVWIDGNPIYQKTIIIDVGTAISFNEPHNISVSDLSKIWIDQGHSFFATPSVNETIGHYSSGTDYSRFYLTCEYIYGTFSSVYSSFAKTVYITLKYVKGE